MTDEQLAELMTRLDHLAEALNNVEGCLQYLAKLKGYGRENQMDTYETSPDRQYWNRLEQSDGTNGATGRLAVDTRQMEFDLDLTEEQRKAIEEALFKQKTRAALSAKRLAPPRRRRRKGRR